jgi:uncharacterized RDD family membrane protein YckC
VTARDGPALASLWRRIGALGYEALLLVAMAFVAGFVFLPFLPKDPTKQTLTVPSTAARVTMFCVLVGAFAAYYGWCWSGGRRTLPQKTWRLRLIDHLGNPPTWRRALARYAACWIGPVLALAGAALLHSSGHPRNALAFLAVNYCWAIVDPRRQFLHDRVAGTRVIRDDPIMDTKPRSEER